MKRASYTQEYMAQTVADYRRFLEPKPATDEQRRALTFEGLDVPFKHTNEEWALAHLPNVRVASLMVRDNDTEMSAKIEEMVGAGIVPELLEAIACTKDHFEVIVALLDQALTRSFLCLERLGYSPELPPPSSEETLN